ncbi:MAG: polyphosphate polymerase domain-containing protein [Bacteroidetes bacterium]|nr:polyphosphate polymerase domain-containing protein [Bacteroidota bacterium]
MLFNYEHEERRVLHTLDTFESIDLKGLDNVQLLNRMDAKYVFHVNQFAELLEEIKDQYYVLEIENKRAFSYESLYFDTDDYQLYKFHHNGKLNRLKVRFRKYLDSGLTYFEVKYKVKGTRTDKHRLLEEEVKHELSDKELELIHHDYLDAHGLQKKLWIHFKRITLAGKNMPERATLDLNLSFDNFKDKRTFPELVVAEVKQEKSNVFSPMIQAFEDILRKWALVNMPRESLFWKISKAMPLNPISSK